MPHGFFIHPPPTELCLFSECIARSEFLIRFTTEKMHEKWEFRHISEQASFTLWLNFARENFNKAEMEWENFSLSESLIWFGRRTSSVASRLVNEKSFPTLIDQKINSENEFPPSKFAKRLHCSLRLSTRMISEKRRISFQLNHAFL